MIIVVSAAEQADANTWMQEHIDLAGGLESFVIGLTPAGGGEVSHYWCGINPATPTQDALLREHFAGCCFDALPAVVLGDLGLALPEEGATDDPSGGQLPG
jgi:hypothetical protein